jgi:cytochrome c6
MDPGLMARGERMLCTQLEIQSKGLIGLTCDTTSPTIANKYLTILLLFII